MADAGLTNGAFYAHFASKDDLVANVIADQLATQRAVLTSLPEGRAALQTLIREYLSQEHRDNPGNGCPNAALLGELGRCDPTVRESYSGAMQSVIDAIGTHLSPRDPSAAQSTALGLFTILVATMQLARAVSDPKSSDDILEAGIANAEVLLGCAIPDIIR